MKMITKKQLMIGLGASLGMNVWAVPLVGVDFSDGFGGSDPTPDDFFPNDSLTVSGWVFPGPTGGIIENDANANAGRPSAPVAKFNGPVGPGIAPAVGSAPPTDGIHQFSITVGSVPLDLQKVSFSFSKATGGGNARWLAFRTSLDDSLIFSEQGEARSTFVEVEIPLDDPRYQGLTDQTIDFIWYAGGEGSGDIDIDSIVIDGVLDLDTDGDGLNDDYERIIIDADPGDAIATLADVLPGGDFDNDQSSNLEEFNRNTSPLDDDSDDDGLLDGVETDDGTFDGPTDTGTDPLDPDSDGDGLLDGVESNDGSFDSLSDTGSDPLNANTDGDDFRDGAEVLIHGTDPSNAASQPVTASEVLLLDANGSGLLGGDVVMVEILEDKFGISKVTVQSAGTTLAGDELAFDLLVLSSTPGSGDIRGKFVDSPVPILCWEEAVIDNGGGEFGASSVAMTKTVATSEMNLAEHPIAGDLPDTIALFDATVGETTSSSLVYGDLTVVGTAADSGLAMLIAIEAGDEVDPGTGTIGGVAPARRVMLPWTDNSLLNLSAEGRTLMSNAIDWALGREGAEKALAITSFALDDSLPDNRVATLEFYSQAGRDYEVLSASNLGDFASDQAAVVTSVTGQEGTTTATVNFSALGIPVDDTKRFFVVREAGP